MRDRRRRGRTSSSTLVNETLREVLTETLKGGERLSRGYTRRVSVVVVGLSRDRGSPDPESGYLGRRSKFPWS